MFVNSCMVFADCMSICLVFAFYKVYTRKSLDQALTQCQTMAVSVRVYKMRESLEAKVCEIYTVIHYSTMM